MGKKLKNALVTIYNALGEYAFLSGKPTIDLNAVVAVQVTVGSHVSYTSSGDTVSMGAKLNVQLSTDNNLYVIDDDEVTVEMGGVDVTADYYIPAQSKIVIPAVTDTVVITVGDAISYIGVGDNDTRLVFHLDGKNRGGTADHWIDRVGNIDFTLIGANEFDDHVAFGADDYAESAEGAVVDASALNATTEVAYKMDSALGQGKFFCIMFNTQNGKVAAAFMNSNAFQNTYKIYACQETVTSAGDPQQTFAPVVKLASDTSYMKGFLSIRTKAFQQNGTLTQAEGGYFNGSRTLESSGGIHLAASNTVRLFKGTYTVGSLYSLRVYSSKLTDAEILHNYKVDQKRFNIQ